MPRASLAVFPAEVTLSAFDNTRAERVRLLVGTGAMWTWVPEDILRRAGIVPKGFARLRAVDGRVVERPYADARIACMDRDSPSLVVFAAEGDQNTLGEHALLGMGLKVDSEARSLQDAGPALALAV